MGAMDKLYFGKPTAYFDGKPIELNDNSILVPHDIGLQEGDSEMSQYVNKSYELTFEIGTIGDNPFATWYRRQCQIGREQKKAMLHAVTHGYKIVILFRDDNEEERYIVPLTPRMIRSIFRSISWIPYILILDRQHCPCDIKHGRLVRKKRVWPCVQEFIDKYISL